MLRVLEVPDFHFDINYVDTNKKNGLAVEAAIRKYGVDAVLVPGDFWNSPHINSEKGGIVEAQKIVASWLKLTTVIFIYGTPSHEPSGSLEIFEKMGAVILRPGIPFVTPKAQFFGVNELSKKTIQAKTKLTPDEAAAETLRAFADDLLTISALHRGDQLGRIGYGLLHGVVSDAKAENSIDDVRSRSSLLIHTEILAEAGLDRWALGDIHLPWESAVISAGYAGSWGQTWNEQNFLPAFNLVEIEAAGARPKVERIPYGTPMRKKISHPLSNYEPDVAYWLETQNPEDHDPSMIGGHPWSRKTVLVEQKITRRLTDSQEKSLFELAVLVDETLAESSEIKDRFSEIEKTIVKKNIDSKNVRVRSVKISGCKFFKGRSIEFDLDSLPFGLTQIDGADNGAGKSSLLGFCTPYPIIVGKDTSSGRPSAIKDFFDAPDSSIEKVVVLNGEEHRHLITIKNADKANPKTECYLSINGEPKLDKGTFDELFETCEALYGNFSDYILTTFYVQPLQGKTGTSLMGATFTEIRNLVQGIAGIDRSREKEYASKEIQKLKTLLSSAETAISIRKQSLPDPEEIAEQIEKTKVQISEIALQLETIQKEGTLAAEELDVERKKEEKNNRIVALTEEIKKLSSFDEEKLRSIKEEYEKTEKARQEYQVASREYKAEIERRREQISKVEDLNARSRADYQRLVKTDADRVASNQRAIDSAKKLIESYEEQIEVLNKPCSNCGHLEGDLSEKIAERRARIALASEDLKLDVSPKVIPAPEMTEIPTFPNLQPPTFVEPKEKIDISEINRKLELAIEARGKLSAIQSELQLLGEFDPEVFFDLKKTRYEELRKKYSDAKEAKGSAETVLKTKVDLLEKIALEKLDIEKKEREIEKERESLVSWEKIEWLLAPNKIPAVELELVLDQIDSIATANLTPYRDGRYSFRTSTQSATADKFNILVYDAVEGSERSFLQFSPGEKAFLNDAYVKALLSIRQQKASIEYSPVIYDESDEPIKPSRVAEFYRMQENFYQGKPINVLIVSHQPDAKQFLSSNVSIEELKK